MTRILFLSEKSIGNNMSGLGLRVWELAKVLGKTQEVCVISPGDHGLAQNTFTLEYPSLKAIWQAVFWSEIIVVQIFYLSFWWLLLAKLFNKKIVVDAYSPFHLEHLEILKDKKVKLCLILAVDPIRIFILFLLADLILCASQRQKELWQNWLNKINRAKLKIVIVPTGIREDRPQQTRHLLKGIIPGIKQDDFVVLWSSGIWPWLDAVSAVRAMEIVKNPKIKLVFFGLSAVDPAKTRSSNNSILNAQELAQKTGLLDKNVYFVNNRAAYDEMGNYLLDADVALSCHFDTPETKYAFRGRILDYIWARLPIILTKGDVLAEKIGQFHGGIVVDYQDPRAIAQAIEKLYSDHQYYLACQEGLEKLNLELAWNKAAYPLIQYCDPNKNKIE